MGRILSTDLRNSQKPLTFPKQCTRHKIFSPLESKTSDESFSVIHPDPTTPMTTLPNRGLLKHVGFT